MTIRETYVDVLHILNGEDPEHDRAEIIEAVEKRLATHDAQNEKRRNADRKPSPKQLAAAEFDAKLIEAIVPMLTDDFQGRMVFAEALDVSGPKVSHLMKRLVADGVVEKGDIKVEGGKKQVGYRKTQA